MLFLRFPLFFFVAFFCVTHATAQIIPTSSDMRMTGYEQRKSMTAQTLLPDLEPQNIGPSVFSCRITDVDVDPADPTHFYAAYASGGLWYTESNGTHFTPVFENQASMTIGDIAVDWKNNILWVGTGEANSSRSSYAGTGIYRSSDGGKTWEHRGLSESHHIGRIILHPTNPNIVWVAVLGHLYSPNPDRGVYKTTDGGLTWERTLFVDQQTGAIDLCLDPVEPATMYAATWERSRSAWNFNGAGAGSGIWKSTDSGQNWQKISGKGHGFPDGAFAGRIGLTAGIKNGKTILYASIDNQTPNEPKVDEEEKGLTNDQLRAISVADFIKLPDEKLADFLKTNQFPTQYNAKKIKNMVEKGKITPITLVEYLEDANTNLFNTDYPGAEVYRSEDGGQNWTKTHSEPLKNINFSYGYYFSNIRCAPNDPDQVYLLGYMIIRSADGGKTWKNIQGDNVHADHHALWVNPARPGHLVNGNDGGLNLSWDNGKSWTKCNNPPVGQFYAIAVDDATSYNVYGGAQDNGVWVGPSDYVASTEWHQNGQYPYKFLLGGDGMQVAVDTRDNNTVYTGFQFGNYFRINKTTGRQKFISPKHDLGERPLRFNWQTPIHLSKHNQDVLYLGANRLYRSFDQGDHWEAISSDLTKGGKKGNVPYGTLTSIHESALKFGLLYTGSDDGLVYVSRDGGNNWNNISAQLPSDLWVSRVQASAHVQARVYVSLNGYRWDDFTAYLYCSDDYGQNWVRLGMDLPAEPINVVREDTENPDLLYVGTDHGLYISIDRGKTFQMVGGQFPHTPVHDLVVQAKAKELVIGTHGRSMYKMNVAPLQALTPEVLAAPLWLFNLENVAFSRSWGRISPWEEQKPESYPIYYHAAAAGDVRWEVRTKAGLVLNSGTLNSKKGFNTFTFDLTLQESALKPYQKWLKENAPDDKKASTLKKADDGKYYLQKGVYTVELMRDGTGTKETAVQTFTIE
ncbi:MAG: glycosyl hydrolase [Saprospiraceae bacterium]|nr:glycosyl hydrolase [Saprospiraceae bacterium]